MSRTDCISNVGKVSAQISHLLCRIRAEVCSPWAMQESRWEQWHRSVRWIRGLERCCTPPTSTASCATHTLTLQSCWLYRALEKLSHPFAHPYLWARGEFGKIMDQVSYRKISKCSKEQFIFSLISLESMVYIIMFSTYVCLSLGHMFWRKWLISATCERGVEFLRILNFPISHEYRQLSKGVLLRTS